MSAVKDALVVAGDNSDALKRAAIRLAALEDELRGYIAELERSPEGKRRLGAVAADLRDILAAIADDGNG